MANNQVSNVDDAILAASKLVDQTRTNIDALSRSFLKEAESLIAQRGWHGRAAKQFRDECDALVNQHAKKLMDQMTAAVTTLKSGQQTFVQTEDTVTSYAQKINQ